MSSKLLLTFQGLVPPYFSFQHTHLVTLWFRISWWCLFISMMWHQRTPVSLIEFLLLVSQPHQAACGPSGGLLPTSPFALAGWVSALCLGIPHPPYGLHVSVLWPFPASTITRTVHRKFLSRLLLPFIWSESGRVSQVVCTEEDSILSYVISSTDFRARWPAF